MLVRAVYLQETYKHGRLLPGRKGSTGASISVD